MAKISTYPNVGTPTLSDMLIGTEVTDNNATKNFMISDILGLIGSLGLYVPYTGATANVDLGSFGLDVFDINFSGTLYAVPGSFAYFDAPVTIAGELRDGVTNSPGTAGQILSSTGTTVEWISPSSLSLNLQQVLDDGNTANQDITLTGLANQFTQLGNNAGIAQSGLSSYISQTGASAFILQLGASAFISQGGVNSYILQAGNSASIQQTGTDSFITQIGVDAFIRQTGLNSYISQTGNNSSILQTGTDCFISQTGVDAFVRQTGANSFIDQIGANAYISQAGNNAIIEQTGTDAYISQAGADAFIEQLGANASIEQTGSNASIQQTGANAYISQTGTTGYVQPAQIKDSAGLFGSAGEVLVSLGTNLGVEWQDKNQIGSFYDTTSQTNPTAGTARPMIFGSNDIVGFGVSVTNDTAVQKTQIVVSERGYYNVQFSAQIRNGSGSTNIDIWFRRNGTDIPNSNTSVTVSSNHELVVAWNYFTLLDTTDIFQIMWAQDNAAQLSAAPAAAPHPSTPSTILTVNRVR